MFVSGSITTFSPLLAATERSSPLQISGGDEEMMIALGAAHTCILLGDGVQCWGNNQSGQLGDGGWIHRRFPAHVVDLDEPIAALTAGDNHTCALTVNGALFCWGDNLHGQLGLGSANNHNRPVQVALVEPVRAVAAGANHTCVLAESAVLCWGKNTDGQMGNGTVSLTSAPVTVEGISYGVVAIAAGGNHTCALTIGSRVQCWGENTFGQLGNGNTSDQSTPVDIQRPFSQILELAAGDAHTCALTVLGTVFCWGRNNHGQLGDRNTLDRLAPTSVSRLSSRISALAAGGDHTCALTTIGLIHCWGSNVYGQLGNGMREDQYTPASVNSLYSKVSALGTGRNHTCVISANDSVYCWGANDSGQLGDDTLSDRRLPVPVKVQTPSSSLLDFSFPISTPTPLFTSMPTRTPTPTPFWLMMPTATPMPTSTSSLWTIPTATSTPNLPLWAPPTATPSPRPAN